MADPIATIGGYASQSRFSAIRQPGSSVQSVSRSARPIVSDIVNFSGASPVGTLAPSNAPRPDGLQGAGLATGTIKV